MPLHKPEGKGWQTASPRFAFAARGLNCRSRKTMPCTRVGASAARLLTRVTPPVVLRMGSAQTESARANARTIGRKSILNSLNEERKTERETKETVVRAYERQRLRCPPAMRDWRGIQRLALEGETKYKKRRRAPPTRSIAVSGDLHD